MRDYGKVYSRIWESADFRSLSEDGRALVMYLLTCQHGTIAGVFRVPDGYACEDLQWSAERVAKGFANLSEKGFATRCEDSKWVWVRKFLEWNPPENPNQRKAASKVAQSVPDSCGWKPEFMRVCAASLGIETPAPAPAKANPSLTLVEGFLNQKQKQEQEQKQEQDSSSLRSEESGAGKPRTSRPKREDITLTAYLEACRADGRKPIPAEHPIREYCRDAGISDEMLQVAWCVFRDDYTAGTNKSKRYKDWPGHFGNAVRGAWAKLWFTDGSEVKWTSRGLQEKQVLETRMRAKEGTNAA